MEMADTGMECKRQQRRRIKCPPILNISDGVSYRISIENPDPRMAHCGFSGSFEG
jgi:hypothetical protein